MDYKIIWMDEAIADLKSIVLGLAHDNRDTALRWGEKLRQKPFVLTQHPRFGRVFQKLGRDDVREVNVPPYRIIYHVHDATRTVWILTVWHGAREEPEISVP